MQNSSALIKRVTGSRGTAGITMQEVIRSSVIARVVGGETPLVWRRLRCFNNIR
jgi:hypothetical protein